MAHMRAGDALSSSTLGASSITIMSWITTGVRAAPAKVAYGGPQNRSGRNTYQMEKLRQLRFTIGQGYLGISD